MLKKASQAKAVASTHELIVYSSLRQVIFSSLIVQQPRQCPPFPSIISFTVALQTLALHADSFLKNAFGKIISWSLAIYAQGTAPPTDVPSKFKHFKRSVGEVEDKEPLIWRLPFKETYPKFLCANKSSSTRPCYNWL